MNRATRGIALLVTAALVPLAGWSLSGCAAPAASAKTEPKNEPAKVEPIGDTGLKRITLTERGLQRLGLKTFPVVGAQPLPVAGATAPAGTTTVPYGALLYLPSGQSFVYTVAPDGGYVRADVTVTAIRGTVVELSAGPPIGTQVVTVGGTELWGAEFGVK